MRNISQYPITLDEMIEAVELAATNETSKMKKDFASYPIGGVYLAALREAAIRLRRLQFAATERNEE